LKEKKAADNLSETSLNKEEDDEDEDLDEDIIDDIC